MILIPLVLSALTHLWNPLGYPTEPSYDEAIHLGRAMYLMQGGGHQELAFYDHPYFGQIFLASIYTLTGYPNSFHIENNGNRNNIELIYLIPRIMIGMLAVIDTFLIYKIAEFRYNRKTGLIACVLENSRVATVYFYDCHKVINDLKLDVWCLQAPFGMYREIGMKLYKSI